VIKPGPMTAKITSNRVFQRRSHFIVRSLVATGLDRINVRLQN
jgi:hypothetical protein